MKKIVILFFGGLLLMSCSQEKTAYVNNETLQENFEALKKATNRYDKERQKLEAKIQEQGQKFQEKVQEFQEKSSTMAKAEADKRQTELVQEQQRLQNALRQEDSNLQDKMNETQDSLENVMKKQIKKYAKNKGYTYVFGMNKDFNILYAEDSKDITHDVLKALNSED